MNKVMIQANDLDKVIDILIYIHNHPDCSKEELSEFYGFALRQVDYYTNACRYLDLLEDGLTLSKLSLSFFKNYPAEVTECVYERIIADPMIGKIYAHMIMFPEEEITDYALDVVKSFFPGLSNTVYVRRSDNMVKWCKKIIEYKHNL